MRRRNLFWIVFLVVAIGMVFVAPNGTMAADREISLSTTVLVTTQGAVGTSDQTLSQSSGVANSGDASNVILPHTFANAGSLNTSCMEYGVLANSSVPDLGNNGQSITNNASICGQQSSSTMANSSGAQRIVTFSQAGGDYQGGAATRAISGI